MRGARCPTLFQPCFGSPRCRCCRCCLKGLSEDRISKARREGTSGYERVKDSSTGQIYEMPLEAWNGGRGGYLNPVRPTEILSPTVPGE